MRSATIAALAAATTILTMVSPAAAQRYYARQAVTKGTTVPSAPVPMSVCDTPQPRNTISQYGTLKSAGTPKLRSIALAKAACEMEAGAAVCYVIEDTTPPTGSVFYAYTSIKGTVGPIGGFPGQENYASYCRPK
jgi:hypothetical protein